MKVGDFVTLNMHGLECVFGDNAREAYAAGFLSPNKTMRITDIDPAPLLEHEGHEVFAVEVDDPYINQFLIDTECFDVMTEDQPDAGPPQFTRYAALAIKRNRTIAEEEELNALRSQQPWSFAS